MEEYILAEFTIQSNFRSRFNNNIELIMNIILYEFQTRRKKSKDKINFISNHSDSIHNIRS